MRERISRSIGKLSDERIKEQIFEQEDQFYLEDGDINVRLAIRLGHIITSTLRWKRHITKIDKDRHVCYTEQKIGEDVCIRLLFVTMIKILFLYERNAFAMRLE